MTAFGEFLDGRLKALAISRSEIGRRMGTGQGFVTLVIQGKRTVSPDKWDQWAEALQCDGENRDIFMELAAIDHLPDVVQGVFVGLMNRRRDLERRVESLAAEFAALSSAPSGRPKRPRGSQSGRGAGK